MNTSEQEKNRGLFWDDKVIGRATQTLLDMAEGKLTIDAWNDYMAVLLKRGEFLMSKVESEAERRTEEKVAASFLLSLSQPDLTAGDTVTLAGVTIEVVRIDPLLLRASAIQPPTDNR